MCFRRGDAIVDSADIRNQHGGEKKDRISSQRELLAFPKSSPQVWPILDLNWRDLNFLIRLLRKVQIRGRHGVTGKQNQLFWCREYPDRSCLA